MDSFRPDRSGIPVEYAMLTTRVRHLALCAVFGVLTVIAPARADLITTLFNTGVDANGNLLPDGVVDPHYRLIRSPDPAYPGPSALVVNDDGTGLVSGPYLANGPNSKWIAP